MAKPKKTNRPKKSSKKTKSLSIVPAWVKVFVVGFASGFACQLLPMGTILNQESSAIAAQTYWHETKPTSSDLSLPWSNPIFSRDGYTVAYDGRAKTAFWVQEILTRDSVHGDSDRSHCKFSQDPDVPLILQAGNQDYTRSGFDRGHLAAAANHGANAIAMKNTFYFSNISPQIPEFNRGVWKQLEKHARDLTWTYDKVIVVTGPLYLPHEETDGKRYVTYEVIGKNDVAVPTHFFKLISVEEGNDRQQWAYILPNKPLNRIKDLDSFLVSLETLEKASGIVFPMLGRQ